MVVVTVDLVFLSKEIDDVAVDDVFKKFTRDGG